LGFKISLAIAFTLLLIIPFLTKPINGYDIGEMRTITAYCFLHADSPNPIQDLVNQGLVNSTWLTWSCGDIKNQLQIEEENQARRNLDFTRNCMYGNLTPSELSKCLDADISTNGPLCLYNEKDALETYYTKEQWDSGAFQLTPEELSECKSKGYDGSGSAMYQNLNTDEDKNKDTKESDK